MNNLKALQTYITTNTFCKKTCQDFNCGLTSRQTAAITTSATLASLILYTYFHNEADV
jgi:hypothetical protein